jgi:protein MPE1
MKVSASVLPLLHYSTKVFHFADVVAVYDDDTSIIQRGTTVIARRLPAAKPGRGGAARYVSGKMPQNAKNSHRAEGSTMKPSSTPAAALASMNGAQTEEEKVAAMFKMGADQWAQQQQEMST